MFARLLYTLLWCIALPAVLLRLLWRSRRQPAYLEHLAERFGFGPSPTMPLLWVHAVSVGETRAAAGLIRQMLQRYPAHHLLLTHMTPTGRATGAELFGEEPRVIQCYLPYDLPWAAARFLARTRPVLGLIMETEVWPNLFAACAKAQVPLVLANARLSARSAQGYQRIRALAVPALASLRSVGAQTPDDGRRLEALGAHPVHLTGNVKFDAEPPAALCILGDHFRQGAGGRPLLLAASTREGEESLILDAFAEMAPAEVVLALVPRHPQRFDEVAALARDRGLAVQRRSDDLPIAGDSRVWLGDSMGEMFAYYGAAQVALIGGSWQPLGGQNLIEACAMGCPVVIGPHTFNFAQVTVEACDHGAAWRARDVRDGMAEALKILADPDRQARMGQSGKAFVKAHQGATARTLALIAPLVGESPGLR